MSAKRQIKVFPVLLCIMLLLTAFTCSCNSLKPIIQNDSLQTLSSNDISKFDGEYDVLSLDTSYTTLVHALTFSDKKYLNDFNHLDRLAEKDIKVKLKSINNTHLKVIVYSKNKVIKTKILKGQLSQNYFQFRLTKLSTISPLYLILNLYRKQENRLGLLKNGNLTLDNYEGGALLLLLMPTFGGDSDRYNLVFKRRNNCN